MDLRYKLDRSPAVERRGDRAELDSAERLTGVAEVGVIEDVEELAAQFDRAALEERPGFGEREIVIDERTRAQDISPGGADRVERRHSEGRFVEPLRRAAVGDGVGIAYQIRVLNETSTDASDVLVIVAQVDGKREAAADAEHVGDGPAGNYRVEEAMIGLAWNRPDIAGREHVADIEPGRAFVELGIEPRRVGRDLPADTAVRKIVDVVERLGIGIADQEREAVREALIDPQRAAVVRG